MSNNPRNYMDDGGGDHKTTDLGCAWLFGRKVQSSMCMGLSLQPIGCTPALSVTHSATAVCGLWCCI